MAGRVQNVVARLPGTDSAGAILLIGNYDSMPTTPGPGDPDDPSRIGALGLSLGAVEDMRAAAEGVPLAAIVADGVGACAVGDYAAVDYRIQAPIALSTESIGEQAAALFRGDPPPAAPVSIVDRIERPVLLVAANPSGARARSAGTNRALGPEQPVGGLHHVERPTAGCKQLLRWVNVK